MNSKSRIIQFGPGRTGTTLIWQILNLLFNNVEKSHVFVDDPDAYHVVTYRDFRDALLSHMRVVSEEVNPINIDLSYRGHYQKILLELDKYTNVHYKTLYLKYELFYNDYDYIFNKLEIFLDIQIPKEKRDKITKYVSIEQNKKRQEKFNSFSEHDPNTHIHGEHIFHPEPGQWKKLNDENRIALNRTVNYNLKKWGYI